MKFYDTSALLNLKDELKLDGECYIPLLVLKELEHIKASASKDEETKYYARKVVNALQETPVKTELISLKEIDKLLKKYSDALEDNNDSRIILEAKILSSKYDIKFYTGDKCQYLIIQHLFPDIKITVTGKIPEKTLRNGPILLMPLFTE